MQEPSRGPAATVIARTVQAWVRAFNAGDFARALTCFADDAEFRLIGEPPGGPEIIRGREQLRAWLAGLAAQHAQLEVQVLKTQGNLAITRTLVWSDLTRQLGVAPLAATEEYRFRRCRIVSAKRRIRPESQAKLQAALVHREE